MIRTSALLSFLVSLMALTSCQSNSEANPASIESSSWSFYGDSIHAYEDRISMQSAATQLDESGAVAGLFEAEIVQSCMTMGCWMSVKGPYDDTVLVFMKDHAFFVPKDSLQGKTAFFSGEAYYDTVSVEMQMHLLEDAGASQEEINAVTEPAFELAFEAAGVMIADVPSGAPMAGDEE